MSYVPNIVTGNTYNIALIALERSHDRICFADARFISETEGLLAFDRNADLDMLNALFREIRQRLSDLESIDDFLESMLDSFSNSIHISNRKTAIVSADPAPEIDKLAALYISRPGALSQQPQVD